MKKLISLALTLVLALSLTVPAFAAGTAVTAAAPVSTAASSGVGVKLNGKSVTFPDAKPELKNGRTMVPVSALMSMLGGQASYGQGGVITCTVGDTTLSFTLGQKAVTVTSGGSSRTVQMDVPGYYKAGRSYVPVSFFAQALGYDVLWDSTSRSAALVDKNALIGELDQSFATLNAALKKVQSDSTKNYKATATYDIKLNLNDATTGPVAADLKMNLTMVSSSSAVDMKGTLDASGLAKALNLSQAVENGSLTAAQAAALNSSLSSMPFEMIVSLDNDAMYFKMPLIDMLLSGSSSLAASGNWYRLSLGLKAMGYDVAGLKSSNSVGSVVYLLCRSIAVTNKSAGSLYDNVKATGTALAGILGDNAAKKSGTSATWTLDQAALKKLAGTAGGTSDSFQKFTVTLTANPDGTLTYTMDILTAADKNGQSVGVSGTAVMTATSAKLAMKLDLGAAGSAEYNLSMTLAETTETPATQPPTGSTIVSLDGLLGGSALAASQGTSGIAA